MCNPRAWAGMMAAQGAQTAMAMDPVVTEPVVLRWPVCVCWSVRKVGAVRKVRVCKHSLEAYSQRATLLEAAWVRPIIAAGLPPNFVLCLLLLSLLANISSCRDLDALELFAGDRSCTLALRRPCAASHKYLNAKV
jgi:hypothetical protein